jgi:G3E family GTPase
MTPIPITLLTGFLGSGKTTLLLSLIPQVKALNPDYKLALLKNEFGDLAIDSQLASSNAISGVREMLNGCICCNLVGQLGPALEELRESIPGLDRVVIETSGSAFPATLAMEVNRLGRETGGQYVLDGVVTVIDVENWKGYEDTSYTAKLQAKFTDLIVFNKWEAAGERRFDECLDRLGDLEGVDIAWVKSDKGSVPQGVIFGIDGGLARELEEEVHGHAHKHEGVNGHSHANGEGHQSEVEVLSVTLESEDSKATVDTVALSQLLRIAPKDEVYRIKAIFNASSAIRGSDANIPITETQHGPFRYILNWAFGRWTCTPISLGVDEHESSDGIVLRMTLILAQYESTKWKKRMETDGYVVLDGDKEGLLQVEKIA